MHRIDRNVRMKTGRLCAGAAVAWLGIAALVSGAELALAHTEHGHPARIHEGSCEELGAVAFRLIGVGASVDLDNAPLSTPEAINPSAAYQVMVSETAIDGSLQDVLSTGHAVMVYESDEAMDAIACGNVGGVMSGDMLITGLSEVGGPAPTGFALFQPEGDQTVVSVIIGHAMAPVSAARGTAAPSDQQSEQADHEHAEGENAELDQDQAHEHAEEDGHDAAATPEA